MKWIFITLAGGVLVFMAYSTYSSINVQLKSSAISGASKVVAPKKSTTIEKVENTVSNTKKSTPKPQAK